MNNENQIINGQNYNVECQNITKATEHELSCSEKHELKSYEHPADEVEYIYKTSTLVLFNNLNPKQKSIIDGKETETDINRSFKHSQAITLLLFFIIYVLVGACVMPFYEPDMVFFKVVYPI